MKHLTLSASTAIALVLSAGSALAVTPEEVWENWKLIATKGGGSISATSEVRSGATLTVSGVTSSQTTPEFSLSVDIGTVTLTDRGDGTVAIAMPDSYPMTIRPDGGADTSSAVLTVTQPGASLIASGTADAVGYDIDYPTLGVTLDELKDMKGAVQDVRAELTLTDMKGRYVSTPGTGDIVTFDYSLAIGSLDLATSGANPPTGETFSGKVSLAGLIATAKGTLLPQERMADMAAALRDGFFIDSTGSTGALDLAFEFTDRNGPNSFAYALAGSNARLAVDAKRVDYGFDMTGGRFAMNSPQAGLPPVDGTFGEIALGVELPIAKSDAPLPFSALAKLVDISLSDSIWGMVDPGAQLPRDPATLIVDLDGTGAWTVDILDPAVQSGQMPMAGMPATLNTLNLTQVLLKIVGGEVTATGALTFDNNDLATYGGIPAPDGKVTVNMKGINALIDKLVAMRLLGEDEVNSFRFGLAMFSRPGAGPDELVSEIEFRNKGLFVNGQQLQ